LNRRQNIEQLEQKLSQVPKQFNHPSNKTLKKAKELQQTIVQNIYRLKLLETILKADEFFDQIITQDIVPIDSLLNELHQHSLEALQASKELYPFSTVDKGTARPSSERPRGSAEGHRIKENLASNMNGYKELKSIGTEARKAHLVAVECWESLLSDTENPNLTLRLNQAAQAAEIAAKKWNRVEELNKSISIPTQFTNKNKDIEDYYKSKLQNVTATKKFWSTKAQEWAAQAAK